jgi:hypothetical protein
MTRKAVIAWILLIVWIGFIYATLGTVPEWRDILAEKYGGGIFTIITFVGAIIGMFILLGVMFFYYHHKKLIPYIALFLNLGFFTFALLKWIRLPVEQIHFIEYGMAGFLAFNALRHHLKGWGLLTAAVLLTFLLGMVDETIQGLLANRVGEQRDMYWNGLAGIIAMSMIAFSLRPQVILGKSGRREVKLHLLMFGFCLLVQGYFNVTIYQFGYLIHDEDYNLTFKSRLKSEALINYDVQLDHWKKNIAPKIGRERMNVLLIQVYNYIHEEALVHCFRRWYHFRLGNIRTVYPEDLIIDKYYMNFVSGTELDWERSLSEQMRPVVGQRLEVLYHSPVADHLIVRFTELQMWFVIGILEVILIAVWILLRKRHEAPANLPPK